ncbi:protein IMPACT-like isoform X2 [Nilaparvata lugens]|nr:protein IMPACT-like isoform X2 [Nilaparvata lugens]
MADSDFKRQTEEIEAMRAIYPKEWRVEERIKRSFSLRFYFLTLYIRLPLEYPSVAPPTYTLSAPELKPKEKGELAMKLDQIYLDNLGEPLLFLWAEAVREFVDKKRQQLSSGEAPSTSGGSGSDSDGANDKSRQFNVVHGDSITDRKSTFQGHGALVKSVQDVQAIVAQLKKNRKISSAKHNVVAYRFKGSGAVIMQDYDDDGESQAGKRLLHMLQAMKVDGAVVVVTRWYGGIQLGQDRFKHYNGAARNVLKDLGFA